MLGDTVATKVSAVFTSNDKVFLFNTIPDGLTTGSFTVTAHVAFLPLYVVTVIFAVPGAIAVTSPLALTLATAVLLLVHSIVLFVALLGNNVYIKLYVSLVFKFNVDLFKDILVGVTSVFVTTTLHVAVFPLCVVAVIIADPNDTATTLPSEVTVATDSSLLVQVTVLFVALLGNTVAVNA